MPDKDGSNPLGGTVSRPRGGVLEDKGIVIVLGSAISKRVLLEFSSHSAVLQRTSPSNVTSIVYV